MRRLEPDVSIRWLVYETLKLAGLFVVFGLILFGLAALSHADGPAAPDPLAVTSAAEGWVWTQQYWAPPAASKNLAGGRFQALLGAGRWGVGFRGDVSGLPGEFTPDKYETFRSAETYLAVHRNVGHTGEVVFGPTAVIGASIPLEMRDGVRGTLAHPVSGGVGLRVAAPGWWVYAVFGQHQSLAGVCGLVGYQVRLTDRTAAVGTIAVNGKMYVLSAGVAVRWF